MLIVFEGGDRCGKTTQCNLLLEHLQMKGRQAIYIKYPDRVNTVTGPLIDAYLKEQVEFPPEAASLLLAANLWELEDRIKEHLSRGYTVIVDRYIYTNVAYSTARGGLTYEQTWALTGGMPQADHIFFLEGSYSDNNNAFIQNRPGFGEERFERTAFQSLVQSIFERIRTEEKQKANRWIILDATESIPVIHQKILQALIL